MKMCYKKSFGAEFHISATTISGIWGAREEKLSFAKFRLIANIFNISLTGVLQANIQMIQ